MAEGDQNSKFFHRYASYRKSINTIHEVKDTRGNVTKTFEEKTKAVVEHFQELFKEPKGCPIQEILEDLGFFPRMITNEMNEEVTKEVFEEEIRHTLHSFQKGKIPGPDGFTV